MSFGDTLKEKLAQARQKASNAGAWVERQAERHREHTKLSQERDREHYQRESARWKYRAETARYRASAARSEAAASRASPSGGFGGGTGVSVNPNFGGFLMGGGYRKSYQPDWSGINQFGFSQIGAAPATRKRKKKKRSRR